MIMNKNKLKIYSSKKVILSKEEQEKYDKKLEIEKQKYERDSKYGGLDERGNYTALHHRY